MTKHTCNSDECATKRTIYVHPERLFTSLNLQSLLKRSTAIETAAVPGSAHEEVSATLYHMRDISIGNLALNAPVTHREAALHMAALSYLLDSLIDGGWPSEFAKEQAGIRARLISDNLVRFAVDAAETTPEDLGLDWFWREETSILGRIAEAERAAKGEASMPTAGAPD